MFEDRNIAAERVSVVGGRLPGRSGADETAPFLAASTSDDTASAKRTQSSRAFFLLRAQRRSVIVKCLSQQSRQSGA